MHETKQVNHCICCDVTECTHHAGTQDYCTLQTIHVEKHEPNATQSKCTDCASFESRSSM
ncbi:MAG: DUF1540 domain-containing protein [Firmicutes bacterium]|nr:DUF1540 domain-containing protein [Bacillota bacterium]